jgi:3-isopropylmalate/(R)-2-methylmalate dehydratase large subunit
VSDEATHSPHTLAEKILSEHLAECPGDRSASWGREIWPGDLVEVRVDLVLANEVTAPIAISEFKKLGVNRVFDPDRVVLVADHFVPNKDVKAAEQCRLMRQFAREQGLPHFYDAGRMGIEHAVLPEQGLVVAGDVVVGADSHTCTYGALGAFATGMGSTGVAVIMATGQIWMRVPGTIRIQYQGELQPWVGGKDLILYTLGQIGVSGALYKALEFTGPTVTGLSMADRFTMSNMAIEAGAKAGLFAPDGLTVEYLERHARRPYTLYEPDAHATYSRTVKIEVVRIEPQVAFPCSPANVHPVSQASGIKIDQVLIGSCTNGHLEDLRVAARVLRGRRVHPSVRCVVIPGTQEVYVQALREGLLETFAAAGAAVSTPTYGPCLGGHMGVLAAGERAVSTTNRNFRGRMGHEESEVYLSGPPVAAASAVMGRIAGPEEVLV